MSMSAFITEARGAIAGVMRLVIFDRRGTDHFGVTNEAAARSFWACVLSFPALVVPLALDFADGKVKGDPLAVSLVRILGYIAGCVVFPLVSYWVLKWLDQAQRWPVTVYGYNWLSLVQNLGATLLLLMQRAGLLGTAAEPVMLVFYVQCLAVEAFMFTVLLEMGVSGPVALVLLDLVIGAGIDVAARGIAV
ncbi:MAG TPA: hypothetical protein VL574_14430 [Stellaceae bacterium]|nr:hypothetical protein [Stellaceae bacterium]